MVVFIPNIGELLEIYNFARVEVKPHSHFSTYLHVSKYLKKNNKKAMMTRVGFLF